MNDARVPPELLREVARDLRPVRPLASPMRRALLCAPIGLLLFLGVPLVWGWRANQAAFDATWLGLAASWGLSSLQALAGLLIAGLALREAVPGRAVPAGAIAATLALAALLVIGAALALHRLVPTFPAPAFWVHDAWDCGASAVLSALPGVVGVAWLASRALPARPAVAGALYGLGAGLMADAGMRLYCALSEPAHVLLAHGGAVLLLMAIGAALSVAIERTRR